MKLETTQDILELMQGSFSSAVVGAAMELGLFWLLAEQPLPPGEVAQALSLPLNRCQLWLQILSKLGFLERGLAGYAPSPLAREAILNAQSRDTWAFQAREDRESAALVRDLALNIGKPIAGWQTGNPTSPDYFQHFQTDPAYALGLTRKLYEIHLSLAEQLANLLDVRGVKSLLDLGGGSGVVSFSLLRKQPDLTSVVVDTENVCRAGRELAAEHHLEKRITYLPADLQEDDLPSGFDMALLCDVGIFSETLFRRIYAVLNPHGRLIIVDKFAPSRTSPPPSRLWSAFFDSLEHPAQPLDFLTTEVVQARLQQAGFGDVSVTPVPPEDHLPWNIDWTMLEVRKPTGNDEL